MSGEEAIANSSQEGAEAGAGHQTDFSLKAGDRIKVLWEIHSEEGETTTKWWGATVQNDVTKDSSRVTLRYDAHGEFKEEDAEVAFLSPDLLKDVGSEAEMYWGRESEIDEEEADDDMAEEVDLQELCRLSGQPHPGRADVAELEREAMQQLQHLPMDRQVRLAEGFRSFVDHLSGQIRARAEASGAQTYVVTEADVNEIVGGFVKGPK